MTIDLIKKIINEKYVNYVDLSEKINNIFTKVSETEYYLDNIKYEFLKIKISELPNSFISIEERYNVFELKSQDFTKPFYHTVFDFLKNNKDCKVVKITNLPKDYVKILNSIFSDNYIFYGGFLIKKEICLLGLMVSENMVHNGCYKTLKESHSNYIKKYKRNLKGISKEDFRKTQRYRILYRLKYLF